MPQAVFRFYGSLNDFLIPTRRQTAFSRNVKDRGSIKDAIEALGVPHPEIDLILVNGDPVSFAYILTTGYLISPVFPIVISLNVRTVVNFTGKGLITSAFSS